MGRGAGQLERFCLPGAGRLRRLELVIRVRLGQNLASKDTAQLSAHCLKFKCCSLELLGSV